MFKSKRILAFIPARAGSKGIKNKNIVDFAGKPLIHWTIQSSRDSKYIDRTVVSTDGVEIANIAKQSGADVPFLRPAELATDQSSMGEPLKHCVEWLGKNEKDFYDYLMVLQPTSPLRTTQHINQAIEFYFENRKTENDTLISVTLAPRKAAYIMEKAKKGYINFCFDITIDKRRRQNLPQYYWPNGMFFLAPIAIAKKDGFYSKHTLPFVMEDDVSVDIDSMEDLQKALEVFGAQSVPIK